MTCAVKLLKLPGLSGKNWNPVPRGPMYALSQYAKPVNDK